MLEVIIGLVFTYLLLSLLATTINELVASWRGWRGFYLEEGLKKILEFKDNEEPFKKFKDNALFQQLHNNKVFLRVSNAPSYMSGETFANIFLKILKGKVTVKELVHQLPPDSNVRKVLDQLKEDTEDKIEDFRVKAESMYEELIELLNRREDAEEKLKDYIDKLPEGSQIQNVFNQFLDEADGKVDVFHKKVEKWYTEMVMVLNGEVSVKNIIAQLPEDSKLREVLDQLKEEAGDEVEAFKAAVNNWYGEMMNRASGWYKKHMQVVTFLFGLGIAASFNADTFAIYNRLSTNSSAREDVVALANDFIEKNETLPSSAGQSYDEIKGKLNELLSDDIDKVSNPIGLGWKKDVPEGGEVAYIYEGDDPWDWAQRIFGWLVTALAISLGAPFWFDLLKKFVRVRGSGGLSNGSTTKVVINTNEEKEEEK